MTKASVTVERTHRSSAVLLSDSVSTYRNRPGMLLHAPRGMYHLMLGALLPGPLGVFLVALYLIFEVGVLIKPMAHRCS